MHRKFTYHISKSEELRRVKSSLKFRIYFSFRKLEFLLSTLSLQEERDIQNENAKMQCKSEQCTQHISSRYESGCSKNLIEKLCSNNRVIVLWRRQELLNICAGVSIQLEMQNASEYLKFFNQILLCTK